jgi:hypothetical protein
MDKEIDDVQEKDEGLAAFDMGDVETSTKANTGVWLNLVSPLSGEISSVRFKVLGYDSDVYLKQDAVQKKKAQEYLIKALSTAKIGKQIPDAPSQDDISLLASLVVDWENVVWGKKPLPCTHENVVKVLTSVPDIRTQVRAFVEERANFFGKASSNS